MTTSLYQKYRPTQFRDVAGQEHIVTTLQNEIRADATSHAYLFSGSRGIGKTTTARLLARAVNCLNRTEAAEPCNECANCTSALAGRAIDIIEIDAASHTGVDNVRENIIENARVAPAAFAWKVFIIDEVHMLSTSAFNALLKTLEEPPARTMFILATTETHKVPATIASRCEQFQFRRVSTAEIVARLRSVADKEGVAISNDALAVVAKHADGAFRDAESVLGQVLALRAPENADSEITAQEVERILPHADMKEVVTFITELVTGKSAAALERVGRWYAEGYQLNQYVLQIVEVMRLGMISRVSGSSDVFRPLLLESAQEAFLGKLFGSWSLMQSRHAVEVFLQAAAQQKTTPIPSLPLELAVTSIATDIPASSVSAPIVQAPEMQAQSGASASSGATPAVATPTTQVSPASLKKAQPKKDPEPAAQEEVLPVIQIDDVDSPEVEYTEDPEPEVPAAEAGHAEAQSPAQEAVKEQSGEAPHAESVAESVAPQTVAVSQAIAQTQQAPESADVVVGVAQSGDATVVAQAPQVAGDTNVTQAAHVVASNANADAGADASSEAAALNGELTAGYVRKQWTAVLEKLRAHDHALYLTMKVGQLAGVEGSTVQLGFEYQFYKDRLEDAQNAKIVDATFSEVLGISVQVRAKVSSDFAKPHEGDVENIIEPSEDEIANVWDLATQQFDSNNAA